MPDYQIYGLNIAINEALDGLAAAAPDALVDVRVHLGVVPEWSARSDADGGLLYRSSPNDPDAPLLDVTWVEGRKGLRWRYDDGTTFYLSGDGGDVWGTWAAPNTLADAEVYLLGPVLSYVLRRRGVLSLHASAVVCDGKAWALSGPPGAGKSTTAAALVAAGCALLSDDVVALRESLGLLHAYPAYDYVRVWNDSARLLVGDERTLPLVTPNWDKRSLPSNRLAGGHWRDPAPLGGVILLGARVAADDAPCIGRAHGADALIELLAETSANYLLDAAMRAEELRRLANLFERVPVWRVAPHEDGARLPMLAERLMAAIRA